MRGLLPGRHSKHTSKPMLKSIAHYCITAANKRSKIDLQNTVTVIVSRAVNGWPTSWWRITVFTFTDSPSTSHLHFILWVHLTKFLLLSCRCVCVWCHPRLAVSQEHCILRACNSVLCVLKAHRMYWWVWSHTGVCKCAFLYYEIMLGMNVFGVQEQSSSLLPR